MCFWHVYLSSHALFTLTGCIRVVEHGLLISCCKLTDVWFQSSWAALSFHSCFTLCVNLIFVFTNCRNQRHSLSGRLGGKPKLAKTWVTCWSNVGVVSWNPWIKGVVRCGGKKATWTLFVQLGLWKTTPTCPQWGDLGTQCAAGPCGWDSLCYLVLHVSRFVLFFVVFVGLNLGFKRF